MNSYIIYIPQVHALPFLIHVHVPSPAVYSTSAMTLFDDSRYYILVNIMILLYHTVVKEGQLMFAKVNYNETTKIKVDR